ncbi:RNA-binding domain-containing protein [Candidatus Sulfurimonas baltica]|uniref:Putative DNA binding domain-containing protein n=1 Tax=Candidatus Sulfurimonas baltica TaxID=2740404 RepID=A0A7S7LVM3_9BACT|nr:RNA-binding domain-containing protein [Candidatus Sulfurimonas baltica]QOY52291.1 putative DNA binding domain-containing protein [Candidatus Sulfurimonas baltica]
MIKTAEDILSLSESIELECKLAIGRNGTGGLPGKTFWETYSAFANTNGGTILLGVKENKNHTFEIAGVQDVQKVLDELWTSVENTQTVSCNLLKKEFVQIISIDDKSIIQIYIPRASRHDKPVHRTTNPMDGTYQRLHSSDIKCSKETVRRMLSEQLEDSRDDKMLENYDMADIDQESLRAYRQMYSNRDSSNERNRYDDVEFLRSIGGWKRDRKSGLESLTIAGLLMFGKLMSIQEEFPNYMLDYQERAEARAKARWIDRISLDGTWSGNLFDFYTRVIRKLTADLKVPFKLQGDQRQDQTAVHDALREALVNTIVHADYSGKASILVVKRPDMFGFRNPGLMRISIEQAISGYEHDCRNEKLHQMFHFIGLGERAGSGIPNIFMWWGENHWRPPYLHEKLEPYDQTLFELRMADLISSDVINEMKILFGPEFDTLDNTQRLILSTAFSEQTVTHARLKEICNEHNSDLSQTLHKLVRDDMLLSSGYGQGMVYYLPNQVLVTPDDVFGSYLVTENGDKLITEDGNKIVTEGLGVSSGGMGVSSGGYVVKGLEFPIFDSVASMDESLQNSLKEITKPIIDSKRFPKNEFKKIVKMLCEDKFLTLAILAELLDRSEDYIRKDILNPMVEQEELLRAFPQTPNDPRQAYTSRKEHKTS